MCMRGGDEGGRWREGDVYEGGRWGEGGMREGK